MLHCAGVNAVCLPPRPEELCGGSVGTEGLGGAGSSKRHCPSLVRIRISLERARSGPRPSDPSSRSSTLHNKVEPFVFLSYFESVAKKLSS